MKRGTYSVVALVQILLLAGVSPAARAEDTAGGYVTREEYEELKAEMLALKKELASMKKETHAAAGEEKADDKAAADLHKQVLEPVARNQWWQNKRNRQSVRRTSILPALEWARLRIVRGAFQISQLPSTRSFFGN